MQLSLSNILHFFTAYLSPVVAATNDLPITHITARKPTFGSGSFQNPGARVRPKFRYWIPDASVEADVISQDVKQAKEAGMGGLELLGYHLYGGPPSNGAGRGKFAPVDWAEYGFGGERWYETFRSFAEAIKNNSLVMDFAIGPNQGTGVPAPDDDEGLMWDIYIDNQSVPLGGSFNGTLPGWGRGTLLAAVTGLEINTTNITAANKLQPDPEGLPGDYYLSRTQITLSNSSLIDVTNKVDDQGQISLEFPTSETTASGYNIFAIYVALSGYRAQQGPEGLGGPQTTPESWLQNGSWAQYILQNGTRELLREIGSYAWEDSIEIVSNVYWTRNLSASFLADHGYDISKWLPILFHRNGKSSNNPAVWWVTDEPDGGNSHIADYRSTLAGLYREYLTALNDWARDYLGLGFSAQISYNLPMDMLASVPWVSVPETESLDFSDLIDGYRQYSGPVYLAGHGIVSSECGAVRGEGFSQTLPELLWHVKRSYAGGVNQFVFHGFPYSGYYGNTTWPGFTTFNYQYSDMHGPYQPGWQYYREYMDFVGRNNFVLQSGRPKIDIAFWQKKTTYPGHVELRTYPTTDLESVGYTYQYLSPDDLFLATVEDSVLAPNAQGFKALVLQANDSLTVDGTTKLLEFGQAGLPIIFAGGVPSSYVGTFGPDEIQQANENLQELANLPNSHITSSLEVGSALADIGIEPLTRISSNGTWYTQWHWDPDNRVDYIFVYSDAMHTPQGEGETVGTIEFESTGIPYEYDAWTGDQRPIMQYKRLANTTLIPFQLAGNQSKIIAFHPRTTQDTSRYQASWEFGDQEYPYINSSTFPELGRYPPTINTTLSPSRCDSFELQNWTLIVEHWEAPIDLYNYTGGAYRYNTSHELESLQSWQEIPGLQNVSGIGYYSASFHWPPSQCINHSDISGAMIDFGHVYHTLQASVNGRRLPAMDVTAPTADLRFSLEDGSNVVEAVVSTPLGNTLGTIWSKLQSSGEGPASPDAGTVNKPRVGQYGLKQQVKIVPYHSNALWL
ncbi:hypothetical protein PFICI_06941 [Pestalotiopsis fici W106-1]|uniref:Secreted protein n=1 Tax=Pestalotiopsis fici (strain W106-1 / CGMCC3.15140) TaxID=1229662 RepID=W3X7D0_PESFW|nr:uncharacterized protein PFICI_06941 [Pestalotiopsis fici W106-1]ETS81939.1 hypothetical protein PFICI_06941 [Pestalotiopsis fici W106-1]